MDDKLDLRTIPNEENALPTQEMVRGRAVRDLVALDLLPAHDDLNPPKPCNKIMKLFTLLGGDARRLHTMQEAGDGRVLAGRKRLSCA